MSALRGNSARNGANLCLKRNPLVAVATALIGPVLGLFRRRRVAPATQIENLRLERYSSQPVQPQDQD